MPSSSRNSCESGHGPQGRLDHPDDIAQLVLLRRLGLVLPAAGIGAAALVGVTLVDVARQQAAPGIGHAQRAVDEYLQLHGGDFATDLRDLLQRQLARQYHPTQPLPLPEPDAGPVDRVGLHRQVDMGLREVLAHQHDQPRVGHDQRIRAHRQHRLEVVEEGLQLGVVRGDVDHHVELLALRMGLGDALGQAGMVELVVAHPQAVARLPGIDRIGAIGEGVAHVLQGAGRGQQLGGSDGQGHGRRLDESKPATLDQVPPTTIDPSL